MILEPTAQLTRATLGDETRGRLTRGRSGSGRVYVHVGQASELWKVVRESEGVEEVVRRARMRGVGAPG
jgi:hypothetical protein